MPDTPTTEGSIVAYLRLDSSDWDRKLDAAEAKARELSRVDPTIRVSADTADALAKLEAVREAEARAGGVTTTISRVDTVVSSSGGDSGKTDAVAAAELRLAAAERASEMATQRAIVAQMRLDEQRDKGRLSAAQMAAAELTAQAAVERSESAAAKAALAEDALATAQRNAAESAMQNAAAQDTAAAATNNAANANGNNVTRTGLIVAGVAAAIPLVGALSGAAFGLAGGFTAMGAAGVLAILGIKDEMGQATKAGVQYSAGIAAAKNELTQLSDTAASSMLPAFGKALDTISVAMPSLNQEVGQFSALLGTGVDLALQGVVNLFQAANPLFVQAGGYINQIGAGFLHWTEDGGLQKFIVYAEGELPQVVATVGSLVAGVAHVVEAFAPWGGTMLTVIRAVGDVLQAIPAPLLPALAIGATAAYLAFAKWSTIKAGISGVGDSLQQVSANSKGAFTGIMQVAAAADVLVLQGTAAAASGIKQWQGYTQGTDKWSAAIRNGNINVQDLGHSLEMTGGFWNDLGNNIDVAGTAFRPFYDNVKALDQAMASATPKDLAQSYKQLVAEGAKVGKSQADIAALFPAATAALHAQQSAMDGSTSSTKSSVALTDQLRDAQTKAMTATDKFAQALAGLGNVNLSETAANVAWQQSIADATAALTKNGATLDVTTQAGRDNTTALDNMASSAIALVAAHAKAGVSTQDLTNDMVVARASFIATAEKMGATADQANALADQYHLIPQDVTTAVSETGAAAAQAAVSDLQGQLAGIARDWTAAVHIVTTGTMPTAGHLAAQAGGGPVVQYRAAGGLIDSLMRPQGTDTVPTMLTPDEFVVKRSSAAHDPGFLRAYNQDPAGALNAVRGGGNITVTVINKTGVTLSDLIDIRVQQANRRQAMALSSGKQKGAF